MEKINILLARPRGFCAGVERAISIVEKALEHYGKPVYVRHEIVHNQHVVKQLETKGAIFVEELYDVPTGAPVIFSAHGVARHVPKTAEDMGLSYIDATCPLVSKVHVETIQHYLKGRNIILIGHANHPEVIGTMGQVPKQAITLVESVKDVEKLNFETSDEIAYVTQTTLSLDDTENIINCLKKKFPNIIAPPKKDICYATTNRQNAVKQMAKDCDLIAVIGATNSSNSKRLLEVSIKAGCLNSILANSSRNIPWDLIKNGDTLGITSGASAPEILVEEALAEAQKRFQVSIKEIKVADEKVVFKLPEIFQS